jgi:hypothetical protein
VISEIRRLAQDPALVDQVFSLALQQTGEKRKRLDSERTRLLHQRQQREEAIRRLVSALEGRSGELPEVVAERIDERKAEVTQINVRLAQVEQDLAAIGAQALDREHLTQTLAQFTDLWDALYPRERIKLVHSLIECITYYDETSRIEIRFRLTGDTRQTAVTARCLEVIIAGDYVGVCQTRSEDRSWVLHFRDGPCAVTSGATASSRCLGVWRSRNGSGVCFLRT